MTDPHDASWDVLGCEWAKHIVRVLTEISAKKAIQLFLGNHLPICQESALGEPHVAACATASHGMGKAWLLRSASQ